MAIPTSVTVVENETGRRFQHRNVGTVAKRDCTLHQDHSGGRPRAQGCRRTRPPPTTSCPPPSDLTQGPPQPVKPLHVTGELQLPSIPKLDSSLTEMEATCLHATTPWAAMIGVWTPMRRDPWSSMVVQSRFSQGVVSLIHLDPVIQDLVH